MTVAGDPLHRVVTWFDEHRLTGRGGMYYCPAHDDAQPSLKISRATGDRNPAIAVVMYCHAGCAFDEILAAMSALDGGHQWARRDFRWPTATTANALPLPKLAALERDYRDGKLPLATVELPPLPPDATADMHRIADDYKFVRGLYQAAGEFRATPYSARLGEERVGISRNRVSQALRALVGADVLDRGPTLEPRPPNKYGLRTYLPGTTTLEPRQSAPRRDLDAQPGTALIERVAEQPATEVAHEQKVPATQTAAIDDQIPSRARRHQTLAVVDVAQLVSSHTSNRTLAPRGTPRPALEGQR